MVFLGWFFRDSIRENIFKTKEISIEVEQAVIEKNQDDKAIQSEKSSRKDVVVAKGQIKTAVLTDDKKIIYFNQNNFLKTDLRGENKETISAFPFPNLEKITCSKNGKNCLLKTDTFGVYNLDNKEAKKINNQIKEADFNFQQDGLIYLFKENDTTYQLSSSAFSGENWIQLQEIKGSNIEIETNSKKAKLIYFSKNLEGENRGIFVTNLIKNNQPEKIIDKKIIDAKWSSDGEKILFSFYDSSTIPERVNLGYYDFNQNQEFEIGLPGIAEKCAWGENSSVLYCGILANAEKKDFSLETWNSGEFVSSDFFWEINLNNSDRKRLFQAEENYPTVDSFNLFVENGELFFIDKISGNLVRRTL